MRGRLGGGSSSHFSVLLPDGDKGFWRMVIKEVAYSRISLRTYQPTASVTIYRFFMDGWTRYGRHDDPKMIH